MIHSLLISEVYESYQRLYLKVLLVFITGRSEAWRRRVRTCNAIGTELRGGVGCCISLRARRTGSVRVDLFGRFYACSSVRDSNSVKRAIYQLSGVDDPSFGSCFDVTCIASIYTTVHTPVCECYAYHAVRLSGLTPA
jgi:hypothetical protein